MLNENKWKTKLISKIKRLLPGAYVFHVDPGELQGVPDLLIIYEDKWALLEVKKHAKATHQPNQDYYVDLFNKLSFAAFIFPENEEEVLDDLQSALRTER